MPLLSFFEIFLTGFLLASIIGPISVLCIRQTINNGYKVGIACGLGAATADAFYCAVAVYSITFISDFLLNYQFLLRFCGGIFLTILGFKTIFSHLSSAKISTKKQTLLINYFSLAILTITNPLTIIVMLSAFASLNFIAKEINPLLMIAGFTLGSIFSYILLILIAVFFKRKASDNFLNIANKFSGILICGFGVFAIYSAIFSN